MLRKLYGRYNKRSQQIETIFLMPNDEEALYNYALSHIEAKKNNPYHDENNYSLKCLGVLEMEGKDSGIKYEYNNDYPITFDEIPDYCKPKHNSPSIDDITIEDENQKKEIIKNARRM